MGRRCNTPIAHFSKVFGVKSARIVKLLTDPAGAPATYAGITTAVVAAPAPTVTTFSVTPGGGATLTVGNVITVGGFATVITAITTDAITVSPALPAAPATAAVVFMTSGFKVPGTKALMTTTTMVTRDLRGDNTFLDTDSVLQAVGVELDYAKMSFDIINVMLGGTVVDSGLTPYQQVTWSLPTQPTFNYFRVEAACYTADYANGDIHLIYNKVKAADAPLIGLTEEDYNHPKIKMKAVPPVGTTPWLTYVASETAQLVP